jgi:lipoprotein-anchoring transpeptidase ErfK/SrfK
VSIGGVAVGGLSSTAAFSVVRSAFDSPIVVVAGRSRLAPRPAELGATAYVQPAIDRARIAPAGTAVSLVVRVHGARVRAYVARIADRFERKPVDARLVLRGMKPFVTKDVPGRRLDRSAAAAVIVRALVRNERFPLTLPLRSIPAEVSRKGFGPVIVIRRGANRLLLYDGMKLKRTFGVATGQQRYPTPLGRYQVVVKWKHPWWYPPDSDWAQGQEPIPPGPGNPLGTRWLGISSPGVGIHGTPDSASIGYSVSHGCVRMHISDVEWLFTQVGVGTTVFIVAR